jgi:hypothetical protein
MSRVNRANAQLQAQVMRDLIGLSCDVGLSGKLQLAAAELTGTGSVQSTRAVLQEPGVAELAAQIRQGARLESALTTSSPTATLNEVTAELLIDLDDHLGRLQQNAVARVAERVLQDQGFTVQVEAGEVASGVEAHRGDETLLLAVMDHGELLVDQLGAGDCAGNVAAFMTGMEKAGAPLTHVAEVEHDPNEAPLIAQAAAAGEGSLAAGIARHAIRGLGKRPARMEAKRGTRTRTTARLGEIAR